MEVLLASAEQLNPAQEAVRSLGGQDLAVQDNRVSATVPTGSLTLPRLVRHLDELGIPVQDAGIRRPTLDEVFLKLTAREGSLR
ncbi:hypothetical protein LWF15_01820 [Kineosporia rhizophila]|nr:hypothetical protein [Kineosporia rhizophila]MCE0534237.1 hypothetical protein [Kineosporia rhizophila]